MRCGRAGLVTRTFVENSRERLALLCRDERGLACNALPSLVLLDPSIREPLAVDVGLAFFNALYAKDSDYDRCVAVDLDADLFVYGLGRLVVRRFDTGEKLGFVGQAAVDFDGDERTSEHLVERFGVFEFYGVSPSGFEGEDATTFIAGRGLAECGNGQDDEERCENGKALFHGSFRGQNVLVI